MQVNGESLCLCDKRSTISRFVGLLIFACNNYMYSSLCLRNGKIRSPLNPKSVKSRSVKSRVDCTGVVEKNIKFGWNFVASEFPARILRKVLTVEEGLKTLSTSPLAERRKLVRRSTICEFTPINSEPATIPQLRSLSRKSSVGKYNMNLRVSDVSASLWAFNSKNSAFTQT